MSALEQMWSIYVDSFPMEERRDISGQRRILENPLYHLHPLRHHGEVVGFVALWDIKQFVFVEHLAIKRTIRGHGYGSQTIKRLTAKYSHIVLEVESPTTQIARRRIHFYQKHGFHLNPYKYDQPPYVAGQASVPLLLMTFPKPVDMEQFHCIEKTLRTVVYGGATSNEHPAGR